MKTMFIRHECRDDIEDDVSPYECRDDIEDNVYPP